MPTQVFEEIYEFIEDSKLGEGCHGDVRKCRRKRDQQVFAVKIIRNGDTEIILSAITSFQIAQKLNYHSVIKPQELFINRETEKICYVMEYCDYPSLQSYIEEAWGLSSSQQQTVTADASNQYSDSTRSEKKKAKKKANSSQLIGKHMPAGISDTYSGKLSKLEIARRIIREILKGVAYLHTEGICHRDLKPDNILVSADTCQVKIIDFEISKKFKFHRPNRSILKTSEMWTRTGTQDFMGPEMFESTGYNEAVDMWAVGVIAYQMLTGKLPFDQEYISDKIEHIREARYNSEYLSVVDDIPKDFIRRMLKKNPRDRLTAAEALSHPWIFLSSEFESKPKIENNLSKSTVIHHFQGIKASSNKLIKEPVHSKENLDPEIDDYDEGIQSCSDFHHIKQTNSMLQLSNKNQLLKSKFADENSYVEHDSLFDELREQNLISESEFVPRSVPKIENEICSFGLDSNQFGCESEMPAIRQVFGRIPQLKRGFTQLHNGLSPFEDELASFGIGVGHERFPVKKNISNSTHPNRSEEFQEKIQKFKEQMSDGMTNLKFIHINQKERVLPKPSQLRLKLLSEKNDKEISSLKISTANVIVSEFQMNQSGFQVGVAEQSGRNSTDLFQQQQQQKLTTPKLLNSSTGSRNEEQQIKKQGDPYYEILDTKDIREKASKSIGSAISPKVPFDKSDETLLRLRSSTNNKLNIEEKVEDQNEHRAKRLSEDFTSSCVMSIPQNQIGVQLKKSQQISGQSNQENQTDLTQKKKIHSFWLFQQQNEGCEEVILNQKANSGYQINGENILEGMRNSNEKSLFIQKCSGSESPSVDGNLIRFRRVTSSAASSQQELSDKSGSTHEMPPFQSSDKLQDSTALRLSLQDKED